MRGLISAVLAALVYASAVTAQRREAQSALDEMAAAERASTAETAAQSPMRPTQAQDPDWVKELAPKRIVYSVPGMARVRVRKNLTYKRAAGVELKMDVYTPPGARRGARRPAVLFIHGGRVPSNLRTTPKDWGAFRSLAQLAAASCFVGVTFNHRFYAWESLSDSQEDVTDAISYVRDNADALGVDKDRIALWAVSAGSLFLSRPLRDAPPYLRCVVAYYPEMDLQAERTSAPASVSDETLREFSPVYQLGQNKRAIPPIFIARAGLDDAEANAAVGRFVQLALGKNATLDFANHPTGHHGFDVEDDDERSREIIRQTVAFIKAHTARPAGSLDVRADGRRLHMLVEGRGTPTVVLESGLGDGLESWAKVQPEVAKFTRAVSYDRAGLGLSEPSPKPRTARQVATELHAALRGARATPPYVLVGHSGSGFTIRLFAALYPKEVAGLVFVEPTQAGLYEWLRTHRPEVWKEMGEELAKQPEAVRAEESAAEESARQAEAARLPRVPVVLIAGARTNDFRTPELLQFWMDRHREFLRQVPDGKLVLAEKSGHYVQQDEPELVVQAIKQVCERVRRKVRRP